MKIKLLVVFIAVFNAANAQSTYISTNYASNGDTIYLTQAQPANLNFDTTGTSIIWNYSALTGISQSRLIFRLSTQTGFSALQWPYLYNASNTNLSSTDEKTYTIGSSLQATNPNDYFLKNTTLLQEKASSMELVISNTHIKIKNVFDSPDRIYKFPLNYGNKDSSFASYTIDIPNLLYKHTTINRVNEVDGWGTIVTPYGTFTNCLRIVSNVTQTDSITIDTLILPKDTILYREYKWLDPSKKHPLLTVRREKIGNTYVTQSIEYFDSKQYFQPTSLFAWAPAGALPGDTIQFQNLSLNGTSYKWDFGDPSSGSDNSSVLQNPAHVFSITATYQVKLIAYNGSLSDTTILPISIGTTTHVLTGKNENSFSFYPNPFSISATLQLNGPLKNAELTIYNMNGKEIKKMNHLSGDRIIIGRENFKPGLYLFELKDDHKRISTGKFLIAD